MTISYKDKQSVAIFYDRLNTWGGAERLLLDILTIYPHADLYTTVYDPQKTTWLRGNYNVYFTKLNGKLFQKYQGLFSVIYPILLEKFKFDKYDLLISLGSLFNHTLLTKPKTKYINYCLTPNRYLYQNQQFGVYKKIDKIFSSRPDNFLAISQTVKKRISAYYQRESDVVYPGIDTNYFLPTPNPKNDYYLAVSRFVPHKKLDLLIETFKKVNKRLVLVGEGREAKYLKNLAEGFSNISFSNFVNNTKLLKLYQNCTALISPQEEDFGLTNLEAMSCGRPVIAYSKGGNLETIIHLKTGIFFHKQNYKNIISALNILETQKIDPQACRQQALKFSRENFMLNFKNKIHEIVSSR